MEVNSKNLCLIFVAIATCNLLAHADETCDNGAYFPGGAGVVLDKNIENHDAFTIEARLRINKPESGVIAWLDIGSLRYYGNGRSIYAVELQAWTSRQGGSDQLPTIKCSVGNADLMLPFHIAGTVSGNRNNPTMRLYFNGELWTNCKQRSDNPSGTYLTDALASHSASNSDGDIWGDKESAVAWIQEIRVFDTARSASEIQNNMRVSIPVATSNLLAAWNFSNAEFKDGGIVPDIKGDFNGRFKFEAGSARCEVIDPLIENLLDQISRDFTSLSDRVGNYSSTQNKTNLKLQADIAGVISSVTLQQSALARVNASVRASIKSLQGSVASQSGVIAQLQTQVKSQANEMRTQASTLKVAIDQISAMSTMLNAAGTLLAPSIPTPTCEGLTDCGQPQIQAEGLDFKLSARSAVFKMDQCSVDVCGLDSEITLLRAAVASLKGN